MRLKPLDLVIGLTVPMIWGLGFVFAKASIAGFPPVLLMALRFAVTAAALIWLVPLPRGVLLRLAVISTISAALQYSLTFTGLKYLDASTAVLVVQLEAPFMVLLGALLLGERTTVRQWAGIAVAFVGVGLIAGQPKLSGALGPILMVVGGAFTWALGQVMVRSVRSVGGFAMIAWVAAFAAPQLLAVSLVFESDHFAHLGSAGWEVWASILYLGLVMTAFGYGLWYGLLTRYPAGQVGPFLLLMPIYSIVGSVLILGETLSWMTLTGGALTIAGVAVILLAPPTATASGA